MKVWHWALIFGNLKASQRIIESLFFSWNWDRYSSHIWVHVHTYQHVELIMKTLKYGYDWSPCCRLFVVAIGSIPLILWPVVAHMTDYWQGGKHMNVLCISLHVFFMSMFLTVTYVFHQSVSLWILWQHWQMWYAWKGTQEIDIVMKLQISVLIKMKHLS